MCYSDFWGRRKALGLTQREASEECGISLRTVKRIESEESRDRVAYGSVLAYTSWLAEHESRAGIDWRWLGSNLRQR